MNNSPSEPSVSPAAISSSKLANTQNKDKNKDPIDDVIITINEKVNLTKQQHQVLKISSTLLELILMLFKRNLDKIVLIIFNTIQSKQLVIIQS